MKRRERKKIEKEIKKESNDIFKYYPRYKRDLVFNNKISCLYIENYFKYNMGEFGEYNHIFDEYATLELASEILQSLSPKLKELFINEYNKGNIIISNDTHFDCTSTFVDNERIVCEIKKGKTIVDPISCVHEFFHLLHLEKCNKEIGREEYYYYTEILGLAGDLYSIFYLAFIKKEYIDDIKCFFSNILNSMMESAQESLIVGTILDVYNEYHSLSEKYILKYLKQSDTFAEDANVLENFCSIEDMNYFESVRYISALPVALQVALNLLTNEKKRYNDIFDKIETKKPEDILAELELDEYLEDKKELEELIEVLFIKCNNVLKINTNEESKKYGQKN